MIVAAGTVANLELQGARWNDGTNPIGTLYSEDQAGFVLAVIDTLDVTNVSTTISSSLVPDTAVDFGEFGAAVTSSLEGYGTGTIDNQRAIGDKIDLGTVKSASYSVNLPDS